MTFNDLRNWLKLEFDEIIFYNGTQSRGRRKCRRRLRVQKLQPQKQKNQKEPQTQQTPLRTAHPHQTRKRILHTETHTAIWSLRKRDAKAVSVVKILARGDRQLLPKRVESSLKINATYYYRRRGTYPQGSIRKLQSSAAPTEGSL